MVARLREAIAEADGVLISTPEFNGSIPGVLKNALDWASRPFPDNALRGKPVAVVGASTGLFGAVWAQAEVKKVLGIIGADVLDGELPVGQASGAFGDDGQLPSPTCATRSRSCSACWPHGWEPGTPRRSKVLHVAPHVRASDVGPAPARAGARRRAAQPRAHPLRRRAADRARRHRVRLDGRRRRRGRRRQGHALPPLRRPLVAAARARSPSPSRPSRTS